MNLPSLWYNAGVEPSLYNFFSKYPVRTFKKKQTIINAGDDLQKMFFIKKGYVRLYSISHEGKELTLMISKPGDVFTFYSVFISKMNYPFFAETMTPAEIIAAPADEFIKFAKSSAEIAFNIAGRLMIRFYRAYRRMEHLAFGNAYSKTASILFIFAQGFGKKVRKNIVIQLPLTHKDVASLVGLSRETASLEIEKLHKKGIIDSQGRNFVIKNMKKLEKEAQLDSF